MSLDAIKPIEPLTCKLSGFPSCVVNSKTEETLPPNSAGIPALYRLTSSITSVLKTEKKPNKCPVL